MTQLLHDFHFVLHVLQSFLVLSWIFFFETTLRDYFHGKLAAIDELMDHPNSALSAFAEVFVKMVFASYTAWNSFCVINTIVDELEQWNLGRYVDDVASSQDSFFILSYELVVDEQSVAPKNSNISWMEVHCCRRFSEDHEVRSADLPE